MRDSAQVLNAEINVTPFLDVLLVLIITFLAANVARKTMDVQLPQPCAQPCGAGSAAIVLEVLPDGSYLLNQRPVHASALLSTLHGVFDRRPDKSMHVAGHDGVRYQAVLSAIDVARSAGVCTIALPPRETPLTAR